MKRRYRPILFSMTQPVELGRATQHCMQPSPTFITDQGTKSIVMNVYAGSGIGFHHIETVVIVEFVMIYLCVVIPADLHSTVPPAVMDLVVSNNSIAPTPALISYRPALRHHYSEILSYYRPVLNRQPWIPDHKSGVRYHYIASGLSILIHAPRYARIYSA